MNHFGVRVYLQAFSMLVSSTLCHFSGYRRMR
jgi:hypothetical protein